MSDVLSALLDGICPPPMMAPSEFIRLRLFMSSTTALSGRFIPSRAQALMVDATLELGVRTVVMAVSAQFGKTSAMMGLMMARIGTGTGGPMLIVRPDTADVRSFMNETLDPFIEASPYLRQLFADGAQNAERRTFPGGFIFAGSAHKATDLAGRAVRTIVLDEVDRFPMSAGKEGSPIDLALRRMHTFRDGLAVIASTPTFKETSRVWQWYEKGDQRVLSVPCLHCYTIAPLTKDRLHFQPGKPEGARLLCLACGALADEAERLEMVRRCEFVPTAKGEAGIISFHANELGSEFSSIERVARAVDSAKTTEQKKAVENLVFGLPYESSAALEATADVLAAKAEPLSSPYPRETVCFHLGVDVQGNRLEAALLATFANGEKTIIDHVVFHGDTTSDTPWRALDEAISRPLKTLDGRLLQIAGTAIDAGFNTDRVIDFVASQRQKQRRVYPVIGRSGWSLPFIKESGKLKGRMTGLIVGTDNAKMTFLTGLARRERGAGYIGISDHLDHGSLAQLASERLEVTYKRGYPKQEWIKNPTTRNELLDATVYAFAISTIPALQPRRSGETKPSVGDLARRLNSTVNSTRVH